MRARQARMCAHRDTRTSGAMANGFGDGICLLNNHRHHYSLHQHQHRHPHLLPHYSCCCSRLLQATVWLAVEQPRDTIGLEGTSRIRLKLYICAPGRADMMYLRGSDPTAVNVSGNDGHNALLNEPYLCLQKMLLRFENNGDRAVTTAGGEAGFLSS